MKFTNDLIFPQLSNTSTPLKSSAFPPESELIATPIFDSDKLIKQYSTKAIHSVRGKNNSALGFTKKINPTPVITATQKRRYEVIFSPNQENTTDHANKVTETKADSLIEGLLIS